MPLLPTGSPVTRKAIACPATLYVTRRITIPAFAGTGVGSGAGGGVGDGVGGGWVAVAVGGGDGVAVAVGPALVAVGVGDDVAVGPTDVAVAVGDCVAVGVAVGPPPPPPVTVTLLNVPVARVVMLLPVTARPINTFVPIVTVRDCMSSQVLPVRTSRSKGYLSHQPHKGISKRLGGMPSRSAR
ncbi:hypothetical protein MNBD_CHLOROFLEXI01-2104 [hydrothermal vent metagenome]|uniref:Uncharacterized protein n=1 Tax=hydrothermal vent metagenome TaxID=652676 RepID=A0A3B0UHW1_9ZZZZ